MKYLISQISYHIPDWKQYRVNYVCELDDFLSNQTEEIKSKYDDGKHIDGHFSFILYGAIPTKEKATNDCCFIVGYPVGMKFIKMEPEIKHQVGDNTIPHPEYIDHLKDILPPEYVDEISGRMEQKLKECLEKQSKLPEGSYYVDETRGYEVKLSGDTPIPIKDLYPKPPQ